ncbi:LysM peptidoglycan-binding domain-containing protein [Actinoplanes sp. NPDC049265]|uniref:LysM peptidoglycan-binding domain-containing protein n=1 Tax=Actinoplanes sp. NPDC049265 TaxID=3363902 RepID=UPI00371D0857
MTSLSVPIGADDVQAANAVLSAAQGLATGIDPPVLELGVQQSYQLDYASYTMAGATPWASPVAVALPYGTAPDGVPALRIWQFPDSLVEVPRSPTAAVPDPPLPHCTLKTASVDESTGATVTAAASCYGWATRIGVTVKRIAAAPSTPAAATTYELVGANEYDVVLLERFLTAAGLSAPGLVVDELLLLHTSPDGSGGLASDGAGVTSFISQANLSTVTRPPGGPTRTLEAPRLSAAQAPIDFVRLLWECSITRSGGFYLYYCTDSVAHTGLPDAIFNDRGEAVLTLLLLHGAPADPARRGRLSGYMNAAVTAGYLDPSATAVFAQADALPAYLVAGSTDSLASLSGSYRMPVAELAAANAAVPLAAPVAVPKGSYQVTPAAPGAAPAAIVTWFATTVAALAAANPGVGFGGPLALWSTITLPALTVPAGTTDRTTLSTVAGYYGTTVDALADANAQVAGLLAGQTIQVAELHTPVAADTLTSIAGGFYQDAVQLAEDNAAVPLVTGARLAANGGRYEVPATPGAGALAAIATRFAVEQAAIQAANPALTWTEPQPALTLVTLPPTLTLTVGTSPGTGTLADLAGFYGIRIARLALDNASVPGLFTGVPLRVRGGPLTRQAASPPGTVTYGLTRTAAAPPSDDDPMDYLERLYSLLSYRVPAGLADFSPSPPGPPLGPLTGPPTGAVGRMRAPVDDGLWRYQKAVPYSRLAAQPSYPGSGPDPTQSPYLGVGGLIRLEFQWNDLFGNVGLTPLRQPALDTAAALNLPPALALYTDPIVGLSEWPGIGFDYTVTAGQTPGTAQLAITVTFDCCTYLVDGEQGCPRPATPPKVDPAVRARRDLVVYQRIWSQFAAEAGGGLAVAVDTSLLPSGPLAIDPAPLQAFAAAIYTWLRARAAGTSDLPAAPTMASIVVPFDLTGVATDQIFRLDVSLTFSRPAALVDPDLTVESKAANNLSVIPPHSAREATGQYTLAAFAEQFEAAMTLAGRWRLKLAVGVDRDLAQRAGSGAPLWALRLGLADGQPLGFTVAAPDTAVTFAPRPISNVPFTGTARIVGYVTGSGLIGPATTTSFSGIDLDGWAAQVLAAVDALLTPGYATAIGLIDSGLPADRTPHLHELATAKENLAQALQQLVIPVTPGARPPDRSAAQSAFGQQLRVQLASFSTTDAIVQLAVSASSQSTDPVTAPQLFGSLRQTGVNAAPVTFSEPKIALAEPVDGSSPTLTFLLSTTAGQTDIARTEASITLPLSYRGTDIEHQIGTLAGIVGYQPSSWLSFLRTEEPWPLTAALGSVTIPLVLRGFPAPPTMRAQSGTQSVPDRTPDLRLDQTLSWDYSLVYSEAFHYQQDAIHLTVEFNQANTQMRSGGRETSAEAGGPAGALAQFVSVYPQVQLDLASYVAPVDPSRIDPASPDFRNADAALSTVTQLVGAVTAALATDTGRRSPGASLPVESHEFTIREATVELDSILDPTTKVEALLVTVADIPEALAAPVAVDINGCTARALPAADGSASYGYVETSTGDWLPALVGETIGPRTVTLRGLNVLARQDAWASAWIGRNENAAEPFRYRTQPVYFASPQYPTNTYTAPPIEVAAVGTGTGAPATRTPQDHLAALFAAVFAHAPAGDQTLMMECRYAYGISAAGLDAIELPVYLLAPTPADPAADLVVPVGGCPLDPTDGPLVCRLGKAIQTWWTAQQPATNEGRFLLRVKVLSALTGQPLIVFDNLQLAERFVDWSNVVNR